MDRLKTTINRAVVNLLKPIIHLLLRYEIPHPELEELIRRVYVDVAYKDFSIPNRKKTVSRASVITGLSRAEVSRLVAISDEEAPITDKPPNRATKVIGGWLSDNQYLDENNEPAILPLRNSPNSFENLVTRYSGGITARAILDELTRVGAVEKIGKDRVKLIHRGFVPQGDDAEKIKIILTHAQDLLSTGIHNLTSKESPRFQRQVTYINMPESVVNEFETLSNELSAELLVKLNKWLSDRKDEAHPGEATYRVGLGIYYFKNDGKGE